MKNSVHKKTKLVFQISKKSSIDIWNNITVYCKIIITKKTTTKTLTLKEKKKIKYMKQEKLWRSPFLRNFFKELLKSWETKHLTKILNETHF